MSIDLHIEQVVRSARWGAVGPSRRLTAWCHRGVAVFLLAAVALAASCGSAAAAVLEIRGEVATTVQEFVEGEPGSVSRDQLALGEDGAAELPITAAGELVSESLAGGVVGAGRAIAELADPTALDQPNPQELGLEAVCYADDPRIAYDVESAVTETRRIVFRRSTGLPGADEISFNADGTRVITSRLFVSGILLLWAGPGQEGVDDLSATVRYTVLRDGDAGLFDASIDVSFGEGGRLVTASSGTLAFEPASVDDLVAAGLDAQSERILRDVAGRGLLGIILLPEQSHAYSYVVRADEEFELTAGLSVSVSNVAGSAGSAVAVGRPFAELADFLALALPEVDGASLERAANKLVADTAGAGPVPGDGTTNAARGVCGLLGAEFVALAMLFPLLWPMRYRIRRAVA